MQQALPTWREQAYLMLTNAQIRDFDGRVESLALDLQALFEDMRGGYEGYDPDPYAVTAELNRRIGGLKNLESYSNCLLVNRVAKGN